MKFVIFVNTLSKGSCIENKNSINLPDGCVFPLSLYEPDLTPVHATIILTYLTKLYTINVIIPVIIGPVFKLINIIPTINNVIIICNITRIATPMF